MEKEIINFLDELRNEKDMGYDEIARRGRLHLKTVLRFFAGEEKTRNKSIAVTVSKILGLQTDRYETCEGALIAYYKHYFSEEEKTLILRIRNMENEEKLFLKTLLGLYFGEKNTDI